MIDNKLHQLACFAQLMRDIKNGIIVTSIYTPHQALRAQTWAEEEIKKQEKAHGY